MNTIQLLMVESPEKYIIIEYCFSISAIVFSPYFLHIKSLTQDSKHVNETWQKIKSFLCWSSDIYVHAKMRRGKLLIYPTIWIK